MVLNNIFTEFCDKAKTREACPMKELCLKAHKDEIPCLRRPPFAIIIDILGLGPLSH